MKLLSSLRIRLILSHLLVCFVSIALISAFAANAIINAALQDAEHTLENLAFVSSDTLEGPLRRWSAGETDSTPVQNVLLRLLANHPYMHYTIYLPDGTPILHTGDELPAKAERSTTPEVWQALESEIGEGRNIQTDNQGVQILYIAMRIRGEEKVYGVLRLGAPLNMALDPARRSLAVLFVVAITVAIGVGLFGWLLANNISLPVRRLTHTAERLAHGELGTRVKPTGPHELQRLSVAFNIMAARLQDHMEELRAFVANASHELRTPLTVVKLRAEALRDGALSEPEISEQFLNDIESEVDRLSRMVNDLLDLSRIEAGLASSQKSPLNLGLVAAEVCETFSIRASKAGLSLESQIQPDLPEVMGNEDQLRRVLYNFMDNAIKYTPSGGRVELFLGLGRKGKIIRLLVKDSGPGISAEHLPHIFERFYRVEATRPRYGSSKGSGLGLAISKTIIENHGGKIGVSSQLGKGATFWVELPTLS